MRPDSVRRAVTEVFARSEYRWARGRTLAQWLLEEIGRLLDGLGQAQRHHPAVFRALLVVLIVDDEIFTKTYGRAAS